MKRLIGFIAATVLFTGCLSTNESGPQNSAVTGDPSKGSQPIGINNSDPSKSNFQPIPFARKTSVSESAAVEIPPLGKASAEESYVGVIPQDGKCPVESPQVTIYMDDEDHNGNTSKYTWPEGQDAPWGVRDNNPDNTEMIFCKVKGSLFHRIALPHRFQANQQWRGKADYAVLKLSETCPEGSNSFIRFFDNEDGSNNNSGKGPYNPNSNQTANRRSVTIFDTPESTQNWFLHFCYFTQYGSLGIEMEDWTTSNIKRENVRFPNLGFEYSVFAPSNASMGQASEMPDSNANLYQDGYAFVAGSLGNVYTDDEDDNNENTMTLPGVRANNITERVHRIVEPGRNTRMWIARVNHW